MENDGKLHHQAFWFTRNIDGEELQCTPQYLDSDDGLIENPGFYKNEDLEKELAELDELLGDIEDEPETVTEPPVKADSTNDIDSYLPDISADSLIQQLKDIFSTDQMLSANQVEVSQKIAMQLTELDVPPIERGLGKYKADSNECKKNKSAAFSMNVMQSHDLQWVQAKYPGLKIDTEAVDGQFLALSDIFDPDLFDWGKAMKIAELNLKPTTKALCLNLSERCQKEMLILRGEEIREKQKAAHRTNKRQKAAAQQTLLKIAQDEAEVRRILTECKNKNRRRRLDIETYVAIWRCLVMCKGRKNLVGDAMKEFKNSTGGVNSRASFREKIERLESLLAGSNLAYWRVK